MKITIRYFNDCPSREVARDRVYEAISLGKGGDFTVETELIATQEEAEKAHFVGSPTVLIEGRDLFDTGSKSYGLACRRYHTEAGIESALSVKQLIKVLFEGSRVN